MDDLKHRCCSRSWIKFFRENVNNYVRFNFAKKLDTLNSALLRLGKLNNYK